MRVFSIVAIVGVAGVLGSLWYQTSQKNNDIFAQCRSSAVAGGTATIGGPFTLINGSGETVTDKDVITKPSLVYFGYTFCPDICPADSARTAEAVDILESNGSDVTPIFISIDPKRDTPEQMETFTYYLHSKMIGLTGSEEQVKAASRAYKTYYRSHDDGEDEFYLVDHSTQTYLMFPDIGFVEFYQRNVTPEEMAESVQCFIDAAS